MGTPTKNPTTILKLTALLLKKPKTIAELSTQLSIAERTVYRYLAHVDSVLLNGKRIARSGRPAVYWIAEC